MTTRSSSSVYLLLSLFSCFVVFALLRPSSVVDAKIFIGYFPNWLQWSSGSCAITPATSHALYYSHMNYAFASFGSTGTPKLGDPSDADVGGFISQLVGLKKVNPSLKIMASFGGGSFGRTPWANLIKSTTYRTNFVNKVIPWCRKYGFDGIDIDFEFPTSSDSTNLLVFFNQLRTAIEAENTTDKLLLTIAGPNDQWAISPFKIGQLHQYLDFINVMAYDYYGSWSGETGPLTPLYGTDININSTVNLYLSAGVPKSKLVLGFANYAATWTVSGTNGIYQPATEGGNPGPCDGSSGTLSYGDVEYLLSHPPSGLSKNWDSVSKTPYLTYSNQFITYDNLTSIDYKIEFLHQMGLAGGMVWNIDHSSTLTDYIWSNL